MRNEIGSYGAKKKLPEILRRVEAGEAITITNRGKAVADIVPSRASNKNPALLAMDNILSAKKHSVTDDDLNELKEAGRK